VNELIEKAREMWRGLSPREQILIGAAAGALALSILVFGLVMPFVNMAESAVTRVENAEQQMQLMARLQRDYADIQSRLEGVEQRIQNQKGQRNIRTQLEGLAKNSAVKISSMEERQAGKNDHYIETKVEVSLKNVTLSQTIKYLHNIEASDRQLSVKSLRIKGRPDKSQLLDVTFSVSSFEST
jgi:type II secretory pathway component PulM